MVNKPEDGLRGFNYSKQDKLKVIEKGWRENNGAHKSEVGLQFI